MTRLTDVIVALTLVTVAWAQDEKKEPPQKETSQQPAMAKAPMADEKTPASDDGLHPRIKMATTLGDIILELDAEKAPVTVQNFIRYAEEGFYNGTIFHRVMATFMIQGGGFTKEMERKDKGLHPGILNEWKNGLKNVRGTISMARVGGRPNSATAQFFINVVDNSGRLDVPRDGAAYAVFGKVVEGMEVVDKIKDTEVSTHPKLPMGKVVPVEPIVINSVTVVSKYDKETVIARIKVAEEAAKAAEQKARASEIKRIDEYVAKLEKELGKEAVRTESGLRYIVIKEGTGASPEPSNTIEMHYTGWLFDGSKFDSSVDRGKPLVYPLQNLIPGWIEGVPLMKVGGQRKLIIPSWLAYGKRGSPPKIGPNEPLVFDIELLSIK